ncbi:vegetative cell wall protein gp1-like [Vitis vinifera]|uniref:vegetative cell wall protein gp1-like n=1 Tax=Vitis vinifera TaxID=29760 RepID=UPI0005402E6F|nr:vegetative cell wall protein gp1-like [Vitis vinifera]|eukprot:XP_010645995.1 PREDICTED: vegetative cell wall protein gp1-like [Vitis vinifera]
MARTRGAKSSSPSNRKKSLRKELVPDSAPEPSQPKAIPPSVKPASPKPPAKHYLTKSGGRTLQKRPRVQSSEPIDLTEQSPEPSPIPSPVPTPVPSLIPMPVPSPVPSPALQEKSQEPQSSAIPFRAMLQHSGIQSEVGAYTDIQPAEKSFTSCTSFISAIHIS